MKYGIEYSFPRISSLMVFTHSDALLQILISLIAVIFFMILVVNDSGAVSISISLQN